MSVDAEKLLSRHLREHPAIIDLDARVVGKTPSSTSTPWIKVVQIDGPQADPADHLTGYTLQLDCYAGSEGGQPEASQLARTVRGAVFEAPGSHTEGVVTATRIAGAIRLPDTDFEPARERFVLTVEVWAHAVPA